MRFHPYTGSTPFRITIMERARTPAERQVLKDDLERLGLKRFHQLRTRYRRQLLEQLGLERFPEFATEEEAKQYRNQLQGMLPDHIRASYCETAGSLSL